MVTGISDTCCFCGRPLVVRSFALPGHAPRLIAMPCDCDGYVEWIARKETERIERETRDALDAAWARAGIPAEFADVEPDVSMEDAIDSGRSVFITGDVGRGKTHLACQIVRGYLLTHTTESYGTITCRKSARFVTMQGITSEMKSARHRWDMTENDVYMRLIGVHLLVLDDIGKGIQDEWMVETLFRIVSDRMSYRKPIVVTSQYSTKELATLGPDTECETKKALLSRLRGWCEGIKLTGPDRRLL